MDNIYLLHIMESSMVAFRLPKGTDINSLNKFVRGSMDRIQNPRAGGMCFTERGKWKKSHSGNS